MLIMCGLGRFALAYGINHFHQPDFDMQAQFGRVLHTVETPQNCRGGLENTFVFFTKLFV